MYHDKRVLAIIPARGGSKGLPRKNIKPLAGKPLIAWTIEKAQRSCADRVFLSTDSEEIADVARRYGADIPFLRPAELARDDSPTSDAVIHTLSTLERQGEHYDYVMLLEPTSPLRKKTDIDEAIAQLAEHENADGLVSVGEIHTEHPLIAKKVDTGNYIVPYIPDAKKIYQRQQADRAYFPYGVVYISKVPVFTETRTFYTTKTIPFFIERWQNYEIDDELDFIIVEKIIQMKVRVVNG